jgi:hypothetical protein
LSLSFVQLLVSFSVDAFVCDSCADFELECFCRVVYVVEAELTSCRAL